MRLPQICIDRPVLATVISLVIVLFGAVSIQRLPNREYPDIDPPVVAVTTVLTGAAPEVVETSVTQPLEEQLVGIAGVKHVTSLSSEQLSRITIEFTLDRDVDLAANDVRDRVARVRPLLPTVVEEPVVAKRDADASPIIWLALSGADYDQVEISTIAETQLKDRLSNLPGVSDIIIGGERRFSMRVWIDNLRLTAHQLTIADVAAALAAQNVDLPSGRIEGTDTEFTVRTLGELKTAETFGALVVATVAGRPVRLRDVARVEVGPEDERKLVRFDGKPAVGLGVVKQSKANTLDVARAVRAEMALIRPTLPPGVVLDKAFDSSIFIERSLADVRRTIVEAIALVVIVIYLFLRSFRATIVPTLAIPVSIIGTFAVLYALDFSVNTLTLAGLTLAIGLVVDDAIVVLENITRWVEEGHPPMEAARRGISQIAFAVIAATVSTIAVFLPLAFLTDKTGRLFREFGITIAAAVAISGLVALTLSPMLCARVLRRGQREHGVKRRLADGFDALARGYTRLLRPALAHSGLVVALGLLWVLLGVGLFGLIGREFIASADRGFLLTFTRAPEGSTIEYTDRYQRQAEAILRSAPEVARNFSVIALGLGVPGAVSEGAMFTSLTPWEDRDRSQDEIVAEMGMRMLSIPGIEAWPTSPRPFGGSFGSAPISLVIQGPDVQALAGYADAIVQRARTVPGVVHPRTDLLLNKPQLDVQIDRERAADLGLSVRDIETTMQVMLGGLELSTFKLRGETYSVIAQLERPARSSPRDLYRLYVKGTDDALRPLVSAVSIRETVTPPELPHFDRQRSATISANLAPGAPLGGALEQMQAIAREILPPGQGYAVTVSGESEDFYESGQALTFAYGLAVLIVYLVLAAQFESFLHPVTIMVAVALSFTGALVALMAAGSTLNLFSQIGLVMLVGLVTKNSILIVEFANQLRAAGRPLVEATLEAAQTRFRPVHMTAASTIVGILPIALAEGAGGEARAPLGIAVVGGMLFSTLLTVFVVPAVHLSLERLRVRVAEGRSADTRPRAAA